MPDRWNRGASNNRARSAVTSLGGAISKAARKLPGGMATLAAGGVFAVAYGQGLRLPLKPSVPTSREEEVADEEPITSDWSNEATASAEEYWLDRQIDKLILFFKSLFGSK